MKPNTYKVNMDKVRKHDNMPPYLKLVREQVRNGEGLVSIWEERDGMAGIYAADTYAYLLGVVWVPSEALTLHEVGGSKVEVVSYA